MSLVSFVKIKRSNMKKAIEDSLDLLDYQFYKSIQKIVIKPNMCYYWDYSTGQTTDPKFVAATIEILRERFSPDLNISIVESDASAMKCKYIFKFLGYEKIAKQYGVKLVNLSDEETESVKVNVRDQNFNLMLPKIIKNADLRINIPKIKYLGLTKISCALKNVFGCNPYPQKFKYHRKIDEAIVALNKVMKFDLCIVDGNIVSGVQPRRLGLVMASQDPVAIDVAAAEIAGVNSRSVKYITLASREGLGNVSFTSQGIVPDYFKARYPRKGVKPKIMTRAYNLVQTIRLERRLGLE